MVVILSVVGGVLLIHVALEMIASRYKAWKRQRNLHQSAATNVRYKAQGRGKGQGGTDEVEDSEMEGIHETSRLIFFEESNGHAGGVATVGGDGGVAIGGGDGGMATGGSVVRVVLPREEVEDEVSDEQESSLLLPPRTREAYGNGSTTDSSNAHITSNSVAYKNTAYSFNHTSDGANATQRTSDGTAYNDDIYSAQRASDSSGEYTMASANTEKLDLMTPGSSSNSQHNTSTHASPHNPADMPYGQADGRGSSPAEELMDMRGEGMQEGVALEPQAIVLVEGRGQEGVSLEPQAIVRVEGVSLEPQVVEAISWGQQEPEAIVGRGQEGALLEHQVVDIMESTGCGHCEGVQAPQPVVLGDGGDGGDGEGNQDEFLDIDLHAVDIN